MWGAIIGDLAGSIYEYNQLKKVKEVIVNNIIEDNSFYSDDTILTIAILDAILHDKNYEKYLKMYGNKYLNYKPNVKNYFEHPFSPSFIKWLSSDTNGLSTGNGAMMRISPIGYMFDTEEEVIRNAKLATIPSHNTDEAINGATMISLIIFYARKGFSKEEIIEKLNIDLKYEVFKQFNYTCKSTIGNCLYVLFTSNSFEESIRKIISYGGDTDTNACIVGSMAESLYGIDETLINQAKEKLPIEFIDVLELAYKEVRGVSYAKRKENNKG